MKVFIVNGCVGIGIHGAFATMAEAQAAVTTWYAQVDVTDVQVIGWHGNADFADAIFANGYVGQFVNIYACNVGEFASTC